MIGRFLTGGAARQVWDFAFFLGRFRGISGFARDVEFAPQLVNPS